MKHLLLDSHTSECDMYQKKYADLQNKEWIPHCFCNTDSFVFYHANYFYLIEYNKCLERPHHLDFKFSILKQAIEQIKKADYYNVERSYRIDEELRASRNKGIRFKKELNEFNYVYSDNAGKDYCFYTTINFKEHLINSIELKENATKAIDYLNKNNLTYHVSEVENLASLNNIYISDHEIHKTVESLIKQINKKK